jgi:PmbA protein
VSEVVEKLIDLAARKGISAEVYYTERDETPVEFETNRLKTLSTSATTGIALRVIDEGRLGFASSTDLGRTEQLLEAALETSRSGDPAEFDFSSEVLTSSQTAYNAPDTAHFVAQGEALIDKVHSYNPEIIVGVGFTTRRSRTLFATTNGSYGERQRLTVTASLSGNLVRGEDLLDVYSYDVACEAEPDYDQLLQELVTKFRLAEHSAQVSSGSLPVYFSPRAAASTFGSLFRTVLSGQAICQKTSPLSDKVGHTLFNPALTVYEDPSIGVSASTFDDEGTPTTAKQFIAQGTVREFYWDRTWGARAGMPLGGNGFRGGVSRPSPSMSNFCMAPGQTTEAELLRSIKDGIWIEQVLGAGQSNLLAGEFSVNLDLGYRIQNGEIVGRIKNTMVAGNLFEAFNADLQALSTEQSWVFGSALLPGILFRKLGVAARS